MNGVPRGFHYVGWMLVAWLAAQVLYALAARGA